MNLAKLRDQPHLSVSSIQDYLDCSLMFKFKRIDKLAPECISDAQVFGTAVHAVLAEFYEELKITGKKMTAKRLQEIFESHWQRLAQDRTDIQYKEGKDYDTRLIVGGKFAPMAPVEIIGKIGLIEIRLVQNLCKIGADSQKKRRKLLRLRLKY